MQVNSHVDAAAEKQITMTMDSTTNHVIPTSNRVSGILILLFLPYDNMKDGREAVFVGRGMMSGDYYGCGGCWCWDLVAT